MYIDPSSPDELGVIYCLVLKKKAGYFDKNL